MATFAKSTFAYTSYASFRPTYPQHLYNTILTYHTGSLTHCIDLGSGHGLVTRALAPHFRSITGIDPSAGMISQARTLTPASDHPNITYVQSPAEAIPSLADASVDVAVSGQAAHWFDQAKLFPELARVVKPGGCIAFWVYATTFLPGCPRASKVLEAFMMDDDAEKLGPYWPQPGVARIQRLLADMEPPESEWIDVERLTYRPTAEATGRGEGTMLLQKTMAIGAFLELGRTWSSFHAWQEAHPERKRRSEGGEGDLMDEMFDEMVKVEDGWESLEQEVTVEWATGLLMARRR